MTIHLTLSIICLSWEHAQTGGLVWAGRCREEPCFPVLCDHMHKQTAGAKTTYQLEPVRETLHGSFSRDYPPVLTIDSCDTMVSPKSVGMLNV